jgi:hypothetical protein
VTKSAIKVSLGYYQPTQAAGEVLEIEVDPSEGITMHDDYDQESHANDIALIELPYAVNFTGEF